MLFKNRIWIEWMLILGMVFCYAGSARSGQVEKSEGEEIQSLIRKDLLLKGKKDLAAPKRNIFIPMRAGVDGIDAAEAGQELGDPSFRSGVSTGMVSPASDSGVELVYIGYVNSGQKIVGLIIFQGEAFSVEKGDVIMEGIEVRELTREEIQITGLGEEPKRFPLEGEKQ
jgi:hypothetical protein